MASGYQQSLFEDEKTRLSAQASAILGMLRSGPTSNSQMASVALKYTSRISDLRAAGHKIECFKRDRKSGLNWYRLMEVNQ